MNLWDEEESILSLASGDTRSILNLSNASLNSVFLFLDCLFKSKVPHLFFHFSKAGRKSRWIHAFPKGIGMKWNANHFVQDLNSSF